MTFTSFPKVYKTIYPRHVVLIVAQENPDSRPNVMTIAWSSYVSMNPPIFSICVAPNRYTLQLIEKSKQFTVNVPTMEIIKEVLYFGRVSGRDVDKFKNVDLTLSKGRKIHTPIINECIGFLECKLINNIKMGDHQVIFGEILDNYAKTESLYNDWYDLSKYQLIYHCGGNKFTSNFNKIIEVEEWWK